MEGKIRSIHREKGFGFIKGANDEEYFFHKSALQNANMEDLVERTSVTFEESESEKGKRAERVYVE